ncbi:GerMN domain-containing protein [Micromonospora sp. WMMD882]|uniref:GerMN domain-containing protein n=1 Tax=Micromonospora sp. WMMD882 TaxID=3015151 RepID=UPI00248B1853|nr:GerMN domain-containing protein [Micromonospora sp. WMMD882]WBB81085.1 GerMN domain-containing protein [Micromonospora sp. WMMD882]
MLTGRPGPVRRRVTLVGLAALLTLTGCGVSGEPEPREVTPPLGPFPGLSSPGPAVTEAGARTERLCYVRDDRLVLVDRRVRTPQTPREQIGLLLDGPVGPERDAGLTSTLTGVNVVTNVRVTRGEATVDVGERLAGTGRNDEVLAFGQIVCTLTSRPDVDRVTFRQKGERLGVPRADGSLSTGPLTVADYAAMIAPR